MVLSLFGWRNGVQEKMSKDKRPIEEYMDEVCDCVRNQGKHREIRDEIRMHMTLKKEEYMEAGMSEADAELLAAGSMGDATEVGERLDKAHKTPPNKLVWAAFLGLFTILIVFKLLFWGSQGDYIFVLYDVLIFSGIFAIYYLIPRRGRFPHH